jgi:hypothetical protein
LWHNRRLCGSSAFDVKFFNHSAGILVGFRQFYKIFEEFVVAGGDALGLVHEHLALLNELGNIVTVALQRFGLEV